MKTYAETQGEIPFDWNKALSAKKKDWGDLGENSINWVTCACGNQCYIIPRDIDGCPEDGQLMWLGSDFHSAITDKNTRKAKKILKQIEERSAELINELTK